MIQMIRRKICNKTCVPNKFKSAIGRQFKSVRSNLGCACSQRIVALVGRFSG